MLMLTTDQISSQYSFSPAEVTVKVGKLDVCGRPLFTNPVTNGMAAGSRLARSSHGLFSQLFKHTYSGVATIEATEVADLVKMLNNRLSRPEFWHPGFSTQMLLDSITVSHIIESMAVVLRRAGAHSDTMLDHLSST